MSRGLTEDSTPEKVEYGLTDVFELNYAMMMHLGLIDSKLDAIMDHLGLEPRSIEEEVD
jgi:hypothetical protein